MYNYTEPVSLWVKWYFTVAMLLIVLFCCVGLLPYALHCYSAYEKDLGKWTVYMTEMEQNGYSAPAYPCVNDISSEKIVKERPQLDVEG